MIIKITTAGTMNNHPDIKNDPSIATRICDVSVAPVVFLIKPIIVNMMIVMMIVGTVVKVIYLI